MELAKVAERLIFGLSFLALSTKAVRTKNSYNKIAPKENVTEEVSLSTPVKE